MPKCYLNWEVKMGSTFEVKVLTSSKDRLILELEIAGFEGIVDSSYDELDISSLEASETIESLLNQGDNLPLTIYLSSNDELNDCKAFLDSRSYGVNYSVNEIDNSIWQTAWEESASSFVTERFAVSVDGQELNNRGLIPLSVQSLGVFGSGQHATTKGILNLLETIDLSGKSVLDVGTGTGILALAAEKLGADTVCATDIHEDAVAAACQNRDLNECRFDVLECSIPDTQDLYDVIVCNILPPVVTNLLADFSSKLNMNGSVLIAGFHEGNVDTVMDEAKRLGWCMKKSMSVRGWLALHLQLDRKSESFL